MRTRPCWSTPHCGGNATRRAVAVLLWRHHRVVTIVGKAEPNSASAEAGRVRVRAAAGGAKVQKCQVSKPDWFPDGERLVFYERGVAIRIGMVEGFKSAAPPERSAPASAGTARLRSGDTATACTGTS